MIIPCMNSTSACERLGGVALVDGGNVLLGLPGAPGCTMTGGGESVCRGQALKQKKPVQAVAATSKPDRAPRRCRSIRVDRGISANPMLRYRYDVKPNRT